MNPTDILFAAKAKRDHVRAQMVKLLRSMQTAGLITDEIGALLAADSCCTEDMIEAVRDAH